MTDGEPGRLEPADRVFLAIVAIYPYVFLVNILLPSTLSIGKNTWIALVTLGLACVFASVWKRRGTSVMMMAPVLVAATLIVLLRALMYDEPALNLLISFRLPFTFTIYAGAAAAVLLRPRARVLALRIVVVNAVLQAAIGVVHDTFFPHIVAGDYYLSLLGATGQTYFIGEPGRVRFREAGILISPNVYAHFIFIGMVVLVFARYRTAVSVARVWLRPVAIVSALLVMMWGISLSGSRFPFVGGICLLLVYFASLASRRMVVPAIAAIVIAAVLLFPFMKSALNRFVSDGSGYRNVKAQLALEEITRGPLTMLIGVRIADQDRANSGGVGISDNSLLAIVLAYGIPVGLLVLASIAGFLALTLRLGRYIVLLGYGIGTLLLTNGAYWDVWIVYWLAAAYAMQPMKQLRAAEAEAHSPTSLHARLGLPEAVYGL